MSEIALRDRAHTDRWDSGSSQGSQRVRVVMRYMEGQIGRGTSVVGETGVKLNKREQH